MAETITLHKDEHQIRRAAAGTDTLEFSVLTTLGTLRFASPRTISVQELKSELRVAPPFIDTMPTVPPPPERHDICSRCYDAAFAILILASAAVALYRLIWMGQP